MKKICSILLALCFTLALFTGCDKKGNEITTNDKEDATRVATKFMDSLCSLELKAAADCTTNPEEVIKKLGFHSPDELISKSFQDMMAKPEMKNFQPYENDWLEILKTVVFTIVDKTISYKIVSVSEEGDKYNISTEVSLPDSTLDYNKLFDKDAITQKMIQKAITSGKITNKLTNEEAMAIIMPIMKDEIISSVQNADIPTKTMSISFSVVKKNDEWRIDLESESGVDSIFASINSITLPSF